MDFKKNYHVARKFSNNKTKRKIKNYDARYPTPKYLLFIKDMIDLGWEVKVYEAGVSKYVFVLKSGFIFKIRFSNHKPIFEKEIENDSDFYVGISHTAVHTTEQVKDLITKKYNENKRHIDIGEVEDVT